MEEGERCGAAAEVPLLAPKKPRDMPWRPRGSDGKVAIETEASVLQLQGTEFVN